MHVAYFPAPRCPPPLAPPPPPLACCHYTLAYTKGKLGQNMCFASTTLIVLMFLFTLFWYPEADHTSLDYRRLNSPETCVQDAPY